MPSSGSVGRAKDLGVEMETQYPTISTNSSGNSSDVSSLSISRTLTSSFSSFAWYDVRCSYEHKGGPTGKREQVEALHNISGHLESGHMLAVLGPSGAGKSCLLDILAGRKSVGRFESTRLVDGRPVGPAYFKAHSGYVTQEDTFHPTQTVREAVMFQAHLRLDRRTDAGEKGALVGRLIEEVGLGGKEHQSVGGPLPGGLSIRGLSGGEKRRLSLCCGTITNPRLLFLDEPTSGLDAFAALVVMRLLHTYTRRGMMIVCTIHQPRPAIWALFDKVMVLSQGRLMFFGDACRAEEWFVHSLGFPRPSNTSVVDYVLDLVSVNFNPDHLSFNFNSNFNLNSGQGDEEEQAGPSASHTMRTLQDVVKASDRFMASKQFADCVPPKPPTVPSRNPSSLSLPYFNSNSNFNSNFNPDLNPESKEEDASAGPPLAPAASPSLVKKGGLLMGEAWEAMGLWWWEFCCVLGRNGRNCVRNPANLLARVFLMVLIACMQGFVYFRVGTRAGGDPSPLAVAHVMGSLYYTLFSVTILPFASLGLFIFDRGFYNREAASRLYSSSAYYLANMGLETLVSCVSGSLYSAIAYFLLDYPSLTHPPSTPLNFAAYLAGVVAQINTASMILMACALLSPNQDIAFTVTAGIHAMAVLASGFVVPFPQFFPPATWLQWASHLKYTFQALLINCLSGTRMYPAVVALGLTHPGGVWTNLLCSLGIYVGFFVLGYVSLANLYKERR